MRETHLPFYVFMTELLLQYHLHNKTKGSRRTTKIPELTAASLDDRRALFGRRMDDIMALLIHQRHHFLQKRAHYLYDNAARMEALGPAGRRIQVVRKTDIARVQQLVAEMKSFSTTTLVEFDFKLDAIVLDAPYLGDDAVSMTAPDVELGRWLKALSEGVYLSFPWPRLFDVVPLSYTDVEMVWFELLKTICYICKRLARFSGTYYRGHYDASVPVNMTVSPQFRDLVHQFHTFVTTTLMQGLLHVLAQMVHVQSNPPIAITPMNLSELVIEGIGYATILDSSSLTLASGQPLSLSYELISLAMRDGSPPTFAFGLDRDRFAEWFQNELNRDGGMPQSVTGEPLANPNVMTIDGTVEHDYGGLLTEDGDE
jgi:hypothetical protein